MEYNKITDKDCLCEGLGTSALITNDLPLSHQLKAVAICPGPNLAYFSDSFSLKQMVDHIYGRINILNTLRRPNMFVNELVLYVDYLKKKSGRIWKPRIATKPVTSIISKTTCSVESIIINS